MFEIGEFENFFSKPKYSVFFIILPALILFFLIYIYGVDVITGDEWAIVPVFDKFFKSKLSFYDIFEFHNEHRIPFPKIIMILNAHFFHYNSKYQMFISWFFMVLSFIILSKALKDLMREKFYVSHLLIPSFLIFNMRQWENLLYGWQFQIPMMVFFSIASIYLLGKSKGIDLNLFLSIVSGIIATYTFANGIIVWFVGFIIILLNKGIKELYIWICVAFLTIFCYLYGSVSLVNNRVSEYLSHDVVNVLIYFFTSLGSPLTTEKYTAFIIGIILVFFYFKVLINYKKHIFASSLITFSIASAFMITLSRSGFGWGTAIASRYVSFYILGPIGLYFFLLSRIYFEKDKYVLKMFFLFVLLFCFEVITSFSNYFKYEIIYSKNKIEAAKIKNYKNLKDSELMPDISEIIYLKDTNLKLYNKIKKDLENTPLIIREYSSIIERYHLSVFKNG